MPHSLTDRLAEIDGLPISPAGRVLARVAARINAGEPLTDADKEAIGQGIMLACHDARVPCTRVRRLIDGDAAAFVSEAEAVILASVRRERVEA